ncbi:hypothetical protein HYZ76_02575 [Candidatus Falkowbacteria bacterium]|nr:hypothetical protein [Candidatus Falkowbacteria bacterium]
MSDTQNKTDDFFQLIEKENKIANPFSTDEVLFRDSDGNLKILKGGEVLDFKDQNVEPDLKINKQAAKPPDTTEKDTEIRPAARDLPPKPLNLDEEAKLIMDKSGLNLIDIRAKERLDNIIRLRLRGIRDRLATREMLLGPAGTGGMGLAPETADKILNLINEESQRLHGRWREEVGSKEPFYHLRDEARKLLEGSTVAEPEKPIFNPKAVEPPIVETAKAVPVKPPVRIKPEPIDYVAASEPAGRPKIEDVKYKPKLTGPIEEIGSMTLTDFRRLGKSPDEAIDNILNKIQLLDEESFVKKAQAIKAWKESEVHKLYLDLGDQSMEARKPMAEIIKQRQNAGQPTLTEEEVEAIIELNQKLRY